jgi:FkbM family methyltransferase
VPFISYSQNLEDVMLWRALRGIEGGFYIDVGAMSPLEDSVTKSFYDKGWCGINVEPNPEFFIQLQKERQRDINLPFALGASDGEATINIIQNTGLSTLDDSVASLHKDSSWTVDRQVVRLTTLEQIWSEYVPRSQNVHFLKIDVEGFEKQVLTGNNWLKNRPWIVVVEATLPGTQIEKHSEWEELLTSSNYVFSYGDGLNRFYVEGERLDLIDALKYPPNVFDGYQIVGHYLAESKAQVAESKAQAFRFLAEKAESRAISSEESVRIVTYELNEIKDSNSWRVTEPIRNLATFARKLPKLGTLGFYKRRVKRVVLRAYGSITKFPKLYRFVIAVLKRAGVYQLMNRVVLASKDSSNTVSSGSYRGGMQEEVNSLSPRAKAFYSKLKLGNPSDL